MTPFIFETTIHFPAAIDRSGERRPPNEDDDIDDNDDENTTR